MIMPPVSLHKERTVPAQCGVRVLVLPYITFHTCNATAWVCTLLTQAFEDIWRCVQNCFACHEAVMLVGLDNEIIMIRLRRTTPSMQSRQRVAARTAYTIQLQLDYCAPAPGCYAHPDTVRYVQSTQAHSHAVNVFYRGARARDLVC